MAEDALKSLRGGNQVLNVAPQNIVEFWVVMTRPIHENGLGLTIEQAVSELEAVKRFFDLLPEISVLERC
ncbi:MAG TPA: hypothetical protein VMF91_15670 [Bryobacteraceae bacterium]|nr:hypothetical protein [Bryobacteraceae bacterium]